jgi:hypothetical protein
VITPARTFTIVSALALLGCGDSAETPSGGSTSTTIGPSGGTGGGASAGGSPAVGGGNGQGGDGGREAEEPCLLVEPTCPGAPPASAGQGLAAIDRCAFSLQKTDFESLAPLVDGLATLASPVTLGDVLADLNRSALVIAPSAVPGDPSGVTLAFRWEDEENDKETWVPQGLTGSPDADATGLVEGRRVALVSFYWNEDAAPDDPAKGVRLALVDITNPAAPQYRFLLLVEPQAGPDWGIVDIHAGGIAWFGDYLYVASTGSGLRVFDLRQIFQADTSEDVIGCDATSCKAGLYKYVLPQVGRYQRVTPCDAPPIFSFVALDRSLSPPALVTGEYCSDTACAGPLNGRIFRYSLDPASGLLAADQTFARDAFYMGERQVQGGVSIGDTFFLSSSAPAGGAGDLYRVTTSNSTTFGWVDTPEDLMLDGPNESIFSLSEGTGERVVFEAALAGYLP